MEGARGAEAAAGLGAAARGRVTGADPGARLLQPQGPHQGRGAVESQPSGENLRAEQELFPTQPADPTQT